MKRHSQEYGSDGASGCNYCGGNQMLEEPDGEWVKYDAHIAEVKQIKDELNCAEGEYENLKNKCNRLQARIDELEPYRAIAIALQTPEHNNKIKAEGVRQMLHGDKIPSQSGEKGSRWSNWKIIENYADRLEKGE